MTQRRLSRPCYDKPHRCPGWAGGGMKYPKGPSRCADGSVRINVRRLDFPEEYYHPAEKPWHFGHCVGNRHTGSEPCGVITLPWALRHLDPTHIRYKLQSLLRGWKDRA